MAQILNFFSAQMHNPQAEYNRHLREQRLKLIDDLKRQGYDVELVGNEIMAKPKKGTEL